MAGIMHLLYKVKSIMHSDAVTVEVERKILIVWDMFREKDGISAYLITKSIMYSMSLNSTTLCGTLHCCSYGSNSSSPQLALLALNLLGLIRCTKQMSLHMHMRMVANTKLCLRHHCKCNISVKCIAATEMNVKKTLLWTSDYSHILSFSFTPHLMYFPQWWWDVLRT